MPQPEELIRYMELSTSVLWEAIRAAFKRSAIHGFFITDLLPLEKRGSRGNWLIRFQRDLMPELRQQKREYTFMYIEADEASRLLAGLEKLSAEERGEGTGGIYDRLIEEFPQLRK